MHRQKHRHSAAARFLMLPKVHGLRIEALHVMTIAHYLHGHAATAAAPTAAASKNMGEEYETKQHTNERHPEAKS